jgi:methylmalonyl-CoA mutase cobalamin-binding subunit
MNRRQFLSSTALGGAALALLARPARALTAIDCDKDPGGVCSELQRHDSLIAQMNAMLAEKGLSDEQRRAVLAATTCPFCGLPLAG